MRSVIMLNSKCKVKCDSKNKNVAYIMTPFEDCAIPFKTVCCIQVSANASTDVYGESPRGDIHPRTNKQSSPRNV